MVRYRITTPEQVFFRYEIAGLVTRAMAWMIDQAFLWALRDTAAEGPHYALRHLAALDERI